MEQNQQPSSGQDQARVLSGREELGNLSLRDYFFKYIRFLPLFILSVVLALAGAFVYLRYSVPIYRAGGSMVIKSAQTGQRSSDKFEDLFINDKNQNIQNEIEVLKSRPLMKRVVDSLNLQFTYYQQGRIKMTNTYKECPFRVQVIRVSDSSRSFSLNIKFSRDNKFQVNRSGQVYSMGQRFTNGTDSFYLTSEVKGPLSGEYIVNWSSAAAAAATYSGALQVIPKTLGTGIVNTSIMTSHPQLGADIVNKLMEEYARFTIEQKKESSDKIISFIDQRVGVTGRELDSIQQVLLDYKERHNVIDAGAQSESYFSIMSESDKLINQQSLEIGKTETISNYLLDSRNENTKVPTTLMIADATLEGLIAEYNKVQIERQQMLDANILPDHPRVKEAKAKVEKLRIRILESLRNIRSSISSTIGAARKRNEESQSQLQRIPRKMKEQVEIEQNLVGRQNLYEFLQEKREETAITRASTLSNSSVIDMAYPSRVPVKPNRRTIWVLAILLGLGLPALFIFIGEILNDKVTTRYDIEKLTSTPILGEIGHSFSKNTMVVNKTTRSMVAEQFRNIRSNLQYVLKNSEKSVILVTSSFSGEGKSYVTTNMGAVIALTGKKTVILELDIRKPKLLKGLDIQKGPGISNYLLGKGDLADMIKPVPGQENLFVLGCGPVPPNPAELLLDPKIDELFAWLRNHFDVLLIDTAPIGMVSDAMTLSKFATCTLYLVRQGHTFKKQIALIDEFYTGKKLPGITIVINDVKLKPGYGYYGYGRYGYGYGYGYGSYYEEEKQKGNFFRKLLTGFDLQKIFGRSKRR